MNQAEQIREQIATLEEALLTNNPTMPTMLRTIHTALRNDPETVTLLSEDEIGVIVRGLSKQTQIVLVEATTKAKPKKALSKLTMLDL